MYVLQFKRKYWLLIETVSSGLAEKNVDWSGPIT